MVGHDVRVLELEDARWRALMSNDVAELDELFSDDLSYTHSNAMMDTKSSYLGALRTGVFRYDAIDRSDVQVRVVGGTAMVTGLADITSVAGDRSVRTRALYSAVWAMEGDTWRFVCRHSTPAAS